MGSSPLVSTKFRVSNASLRLFCYLQCSRINLKLNKKQLEKHSAETFENEKEDGAFYIITHGLSNKRKHIRKNANVAICGDWFTSHGQGSNLGWFCKEENREIADKLRSAFSSWMNHEHNDFDDENTCIFRIQLTHGILFSHGTRYELYFTAETDGKI